MVTRTGFVPWRAINDEGEREREDAAETSKEREEPVSERGRGTGMDLGL